MANFYEVDFRRAKMLEFWWGSKNPLSLLIVMFMKLFRVRIPGSSDDPNVDSTFEFMVDNLPPEVEARFGALKSELASLGFIEPLYHLIEDHGTQTRWYWATFRHRSGEHCARIHHRQYDKAAKSDRGTFVLFITSFMDDTFLVSSSGKPDVLEPNCVQMNRMPGAATMKLWMKHAEMVTRVKEHKPIQMIASHQELVLICERLHSLQSDFHLSRGFFRMRDSEEQAKADLFSANVEAARASGMEHPAIMAEIIRLQDQKPKWSSGLWVLIISVVAFLLVGAARWDWKFTLLLIPVLLFHEAGHWVAMRLFNYRNLRMFFIPFFGAAVTGKNWNVPGWKKALVSLAGPLPGLTLGTILGVIGMVSNNLMLKNAALMLIVINGFKLLPVLPLDGGRFLHATLFCRNRWLDIAFRVVAVLGMAGLAAAGNGRVTLYLAIALAIGLPLAFKVGKVIDRLRHEALPPPLPGEDTIPIPTAQVLISAIKAELPKNTSNNVIAQQTLHAYETLNARPPGILATLSLLVLYCSAVVVPLICAFFLFISKQGGIRDFMGAAGRQPKEAIACSECEIWRGANSAKHGKVNLLVSRFKKAADGRAAMAQWKSRLPDKSAATLFGKSFVLQLPAEDKAAREKWFTELQQASANTFVVVSNNEINLSLMFIAPSDESAARLEQELNRYFIAPGSAGLIPPWHPKFAAKEFESARKARAVWQEINSQVSAVWTNASLEKLSKKIAEANRRGARDEATQLREEHRKFAQDLQDDARGRLRKRYAATPYADLVGLEAQLEALDYTNRTERLEVTRKIQQQLGAMEGAEGTQGTELGSASRHGLMVEIPWLSVPDPVNNLNLILNWLCDEKCMGVKYQVQDLSFGMGDASADHS